MKKIIFIFAVMLIINQSIFGQDTERKFTIQLSPMVLFSDFFVTNSEDNMFSIDLEGQYKLRSTSNISLTLSFLWSDRTIEDYFSQQDSYKENIIQVGIKPMYIYRPFGTGLKGFYLGFYPNVGFHNVKKDNENTFYTELGFGINIGYKWVFDTGFTMQIGGGIGKTFSFPSKTGWDAFINSDGRLTVTRSDIVLLDFFKLGYSF
ncbi:MAG: DUF5777 family beta-barrel protein [Spirochaetaceae bacterium]|nr:DUF5777 family beta-barrel protein [Spirochaetaceae bacterium]